MIGTHTITSQRQALARDAHIFIIYLRIESILEQYLATFRPEEENSIKHI